jgi:hypothetical protein
VYCPICGAESTQGLNYCKRCGAGLSASTTPIEQKSSIGKAMGLMLFLVSFVSIAGFISLFTTVYNLGERPGLEKTTIGVMAFGGATVVGVVGLLVWLLLRLTTGHQPAASSEKPANLISRDYSVSQLPAPPVGMPSVTENTTRNFDPSRYREKGERD